MDTLQPVLQGDLELEVNNNITQHYIIYTSIGPLRPLWPILGIIASFTITAVFILGGYVVDKIRGEEKQSLEQDEINGKYISLSPSR